MQRHNSNSNAQPGHSTTHSKYSSTQSTSSAFSASANPNEDWTKVSDLAERRRIQNRIAQRNYRKKIKRRLEVLERRAGSSSASPEQLPAELVPPRQNSDDSIKRRKSKGGPHKLTRRESPPCPSLQCSNLESGQPPAFPYPYSRDMSNSPPPSFSYTYSPTEIVHHPPHSTPPFHSLPAPVSDYPGNPLCLPPLPATLPSMSPYEFGPAKEGAWFDDEDILSHYNMTYPPLAGVDMTNAHTPPLSHSHSFECSRGGSPATMFPGTPVSIPDSPRLIIR